ncbi:TniB family NTP-binding protein [Thioclava pacifica]|uniref:TniB family NTP-binding protein n=1 Tax=Thioclava pacifica TaxID=285109 RepID=UPI000AED8B99|nr:TniB family NTP-binding protein [Thioclava pacifica]
MHLLPGTTEFSIVAKGSYDAEAKPAMSLSEFDGWFVLEICRYNNGVHSSLGCTPVANWEALAAEMSSDIPFEMEAFRESLLPSEKRQVRRDGIHLFDIRYWSDALAGRVARKDGKVVVRYDPRDISTIWVELDGGRCVEPRYRNLEIPPVSLREYREAMKMARTLGKTGSNELVLAELIRQQRQIEGESRVLTKAERRSRERRSASKGPAPEDPRSRGCDWSTPVIRPARCSRWSDGKVRAGETGEDGRIAFIQSDIWIDFPRAERVLERLQSLIDAPRQTRMPGLLVHGASGIGKTMIARNLSRRYAPEYDLAPGIPHTPVLLLQAPPAPDERRFYLHILAAVGAPATTLGVRAQSVAPSKSE